MFFKPPFVCYLFVLVGLMIKHAHVGQGTVFSSVQAPFGPPAWSVDLSIISLCTHIDSTYEPRFFRKSVVIEIG